jgi:hypothetical protein
MFKKDFLDSVPRFQGQPLHIKREPLMEGREATFWHLITEGEIEQTRNPHEMRCERIRWPRPVIERCPCTDLKVWRNRRAGGPRTVIALHDFSYVVILAERKGYYLPWTAYPVDRGHTRRKLQKEHEAYSRNLGPPL